ncbi:hypothetical protein HEK616_02450 [Streptomyces nigrescens]|uniref:DUF4352 domain-containing protein n=2 Tax=Streptomyces TaxID=1883 RepID=A0ABM7ZK44_STRNI|nr:DUF4190 domain-containing protein [Streptomyces nigrescens]MEE4424666.1 DUF4190 domain-containing protein [Streptomyces sp. DSM 41528]BDM66758.1 hypothetical protein HEK616_02450 [Streptomyces nigrescens]
MSQQMHFQPAPQGHAAPQQARNGLGIAALILGIIGALSGIPMILFWLAGPLGILALIFGLVGMSRAKKGQATNKGVAITGTILGALSIILAVVGVIVTLMAVNKAVDEVHKEYEKQSGSSSNIKDLGAGAAAKYNNGLEVTVSKPTPYTVDKNTLISGHTEGNKAWKVTVTLKNTGTKAATNPLMTTEAEADGKKAEEVDDDKHGILHHDWEKQLDPKESDSVEMVFDAPPTAKQLDIKITPDLLLDPANWKLAL